LQRPHRTRHRRLLITGAAAAGGGGSGSEAVRAVALRQLGQRVPLEVDHRLQQPQTGAVGACARASLPAATAAAATAQQVCVLRGTVATAAGGSGAAAATR
jgi:hypothetical protein